jgi:hypothetical protein
MAKISSIYIFFKKIMQAPFYVQNSINWSLKNTVELKTHKNREYYLILISFVLSLFFKILSIYFLI